MKLWKGWALCKKTYQKAKAKVDSVTQKDVKDWFDRNVEKKTKMRGWNSYIAPRICDEFEMDVFEMPKEYPGYKDFRWDCWPSTFLVNTCQSYH